MKWAMDLLERPMVLILVLVVIRFAVVMPEYVFLFLFDETHGRDHLSFFSHQQQTFHRTMQKTA